MTSTAVDTNSITPATRPDLTPKGLAGVRQVEVKRDVANPADRGAGILRQRVTFVSEGDELPLYCVSRVPGR